MSTEKTYAECERDALQFNWPVLCNDHTVFRVLSKYDSQRRAYRPYPKRWPHEVKIEYAEGPKATDPDDGGKQGTDMRLYTLIDYNGDVLAQYTIDDFGKLKTIIKP